MRLVPAPGVPGDPNAGRQAFTDASIYPTAGCGTCHTLPGVSAGVFPFAPNLNNFTLRPTFAGDSMPASPENLKRWIMDPPSMKSDAKMPKLPNLTDRQAEDIAAFLYAYPYNTAGR
jgi:cytochrome c1